MNFNTQNITTEAEQAAQWLQQGKLLAYPTESVWGIGCDAYNQKAVNQILRIKNRPAAKGMIVVTDSIERIRPLINLLPTQRQQQVIDSWSSQSKAPQSKSAQSNKSDAAKDTKQAHTWLLPLPKSEPDSGSQSKPEPMVLTPQDPVIPYWITGKHDSIAVRVISHPLIAQLCQKMVSDSNPYGLIVSTSCNPSGQAPAVTFEQAYAYFKQDIGYLQGDTLGYTLPSQIREGLTGDIIR